MWANNLLLMYIVHGILIATNLVITVIIIKFVRHMANIEFKVDLVLKIYEQSFLDNNKKEIVKDG